MAHDPRSRPSFYISHAVYAKHIANDFRGINDLPNDAAKEIRAFFGEKTIGIFASGVAPQRENSFPPEQIGGIEWARFEKPEDRQAGEGPINMNRYRIEKPDAHGYPVYLDDDKNSTLATHWSDLPDLDIYLM
jgi:hypothetical protein